MIADHPKPFNPVRRRGLTTVVALAAAGWVPAAWSVPKQRLPMSISLRDELIAAAQVDQPLVVMVSLARCPWCDVVRDHYLAPMHERDGLRVVQVDMLGQQATHGVDGKLTTHGEQVRRWAVKIAPTVMFLGRDGQEVASRLEGGGSDFYSAYLDQRLEQARQAMSA